MSLAPIGSYQPLFELASGGMGVIYVARKSGDAGFERLVVLKRVHRHLLADPAFRSMLRDEARVLSLVHDAHVASVLDVVESDGELTIVLEYIESMSLAALLTSAKERAELLPVPVAVRIVADALAGLHAAHVAVNAEGKPLGLIHRDVSPQNILVGFDGASRLIDFGIAKATARPVRASRPDDTASGVLKGKLRYMSPEQLAQTPVDVRSDVYSVGLVLYEAVTGQRIYGGTDEADVLLNKLLSNVKPPTEWVSDLPLALEWVILKALERERSDRFASAAEFEEALTRTVVAASTREVARFVEALGSSQLETRREQIRRSARAATPSVRPPSPSSRPPPAVATRRSSVWIPFVVIAVLVAGVAAFVAGRRTRLPPAVVTAEPSETATAAPETSAPVAVDTAPLAAEPTGEAEAATTAQGAPHPRATVHRSLQPAAPHAPAELHRNPYSHRGD